jgi:vacuolar iron transporter family protein
MKKKYEHLQVEFDTAYLYQKVAEAQTEDANKQVLLKLSAIEMRHAEHALEQVRVTDPHAQMPAPSMRARAQLAVAKVFGYGAVIHRLMALEKNLAQAAVSAKRQQGATVTGYEHMHLKIIESLNEKPDFSVNTGILKDFEGRHKSIGGNALRAAVLGFNDGLVSNLSLVMGIAGAAANDRMILLSGLAGLLAGAISMAIGEWLSVQSSRELYLNQIALEEAEITNAPEEEQRELALLYQAKGFGQVEAEKLAADVFLDKSKALDTMIIEELGIDKEELGGSAWEAALTSFVLFAIGAMIPLFPYFVATGLTARYWSLGAAVVGLLSVGALSSLFTGRSVWYSGLRQVLFGAAAAAVTFGFGRLIGANLG